MIYLAADHRGFELKQKLFKRLQDEGLIVADLGNDHLDPIDDYPEFAKKVAIATLSSDENRGILICGSGTGMNIVANKFSGVRSTLAFDKIRAVQARAHEDVNIISLPADILDEEKAWEIVLAFLNTPFSEEQRHTRRLQQIQDIEKEI